MVALVVGWAWECPDGPLLPHVHEGNLLVQYATVCQSVETLVRMKRKLKTECLELIPPKQLASRAVLGGSPSLPPPYLLSILTVVRSGITFWEGL